MEKEQRTVRIVGALARNAGKVILSAVLVTVVFSLSGSGVTTSLTACYGIGAAIALGCTALT